MNEETLARRLFKEQIRKELLAEIKKFQVGWIHNGEMLVRKTFDAWDGYLFVIPNEKYQELFKNE